MPDDEVLPNLEAATDPPRKLPNMNEFSPGVLGTNNIKKFISSLTPSEGDKPRMISEISSRYPRIAATPGTQRANRANNVLIGMSQCGLLEKEGDNVTAKFTRLAHEIIQSGDDLTANKIFSRHLLENAFGLELLDALGMLRARGEDVTLQAIREELRARGFEVTENEGNASKIRQWLEGSGIINENWEVDEGKLREIIGATTSTLAQWHGLSRGKRVFLELLKGQDQAEPNEWFAVRHIKKLSEDIYGRSIFPEGRLRAEVIDPLAAESWLESRGIGKGRGGDSGDVRALPQLRDVTIKLSVDVSAGIPLDLRDKLAVPLEKIFKDLDFPDTHVKGLALELLALRLCRDVGLSPVCFRERSVKTQGAEVDLVANGVHLIYSRWLLQCKNTAQVHVSDIAKEVGMAVVLKAHVIMLVTTGKFGRAVRTYADGLAATSVLQAVLVDGELLKKYRSNGASSVIDWLHANARHVLTLKEPQLFDVEE
jgi:hypothetical protein